MYNLIIKPLNQKTTVDRLIEIIYEETGKNIEEIYEQEIMKYILDDDSLTYTIVKLRIENEMDLYIPDNRLHKNMSVYNIIELIKEIKREC